MTTTDETTETTLPGAHLTDTDLINLVRELAAQPVERPRFGSLPPRRAIADDLYAHADQLDGGATRSDPDRRLAAVRDLAQSWTVLHGDGDTTLADAGRVILDAPAPAGRQAVHDALWRAFGETGVALTAADSALEAEMSDTQRTALLEPLRAIREHLRAIVTMLEAQ